MRILPLILGCVGLIVSIAVSALVDWSNTTKLAFIISSTLAGLIVGGMLDSSNRSY